MQRVYTYLVIPSSSRALATVLLDGLLLGCCQRGEHWLRLHLPFQPPDLEHWWGARDPPQMAASSACVVRWLLTLFRLGRGRSR